MAVKQDINVGLLVFVGLVGVMLLLISVWGVEGWYAYEVDLLNAVRYDTDRNVDWGRMRDEQYANIGDPVGNATIYAAAEGAGEMLGGSEGYRFSSRERDVAVIPIHAAMAQIIRQHGNQQVTVDQLRQIDRAPVSIVNESFAGFMTPVKPQPEAGGNEGLDVPSTQPVAPESP